MTLNEWEQSNIEVLTSREMGEWLGRRENRLLDKIRDEIEQAKTIELKTGDIAFKANADVVINPQYRNFTSGLNIALQIIDKYKS